MASAVNIYDDCPLADELLLKAALDGERGLPNGFGAAMAGDADKQVHFANADKLAKQIVAKESIFSQELL